MVKSGEDVVDFDMNSTLYLINRGQKATQCHAKTGVETTLNQDARVDRLKCERQQDNLSNLKNVIILN